MFPGYTPCGFKGPKHKYSSYWNSRLDCATSGEYSPEKVKAGLAAQTCPLLIAIWETPLGVNYLRPLAQVVNRQ